MNNKKKLNFLLEDKGKYILNYLDINTDDDDFGTAFYKDKIVFTSTRSVSKLVNRKYNWNGKAYLDLIKVDVIDHQFTNPVSFDNSINGNLHDGPVSFSDNGNFMVFTRNNYNSERKSKVIHLQLFFSSYLNGKWSEPIPFVYNNLEYSVGHPSLTEDGKTLYFASDMPGGYGKTDLYKSLKKDNGEWSKPINLGAKINTEADEMFPYFDQSRGILFFSSNGRYGIGGLDVFSCAVEKMEFGPVINLGFPLNSRNDDYAFIIDSISNVGYISSNRRGKGDDIYSVNVTGNFEVGKRIFGITMTNQGIPIPNTAITLYDEKYTPLAAYNTNDDASFLFLVESDKKFIVEGKKNNFLDGTKSVNTLSTEMIVRADIIMDEQNNDQNQSDTTLEKQIIIGNDLAKIIISNDSYQGDLKTKSAYFDLDKSTIRPDAKIELDQIAKIMNQYPDMIIEIGSYTDCSGREVYNQSLSEKRAIASLNYIKDKITNPERIYGKGYGETKLLNDCNCDDSFFSTCPDDENQKNRRTEFIIIKK
jgi:outer membrane protein OmpA-like peptidoglycan-associated protein